VKRRFSLGTFAPRSENTGKRKVLIPGKWRGGKGGKGEGVESGRGWEGEGVGPTSSTSKNPLKYMPWVFA